MTKALAIAFKAQCISLMDAHKLTPTEMVGASLSLAMIRAKLAGLDRDALHLALDSAILKGAPDIDGADESLTAVKAAGGPWEPTEAVKLNG